MKQGGSSGVSMPRQLYDSSQVAFLSLLSATRILSFPESILPFWSEMNLRAHTSVQMAGPAITFQRFACLTWSIPGDRQPCTPPSEGTPVLMAHLQRCVAVCMPEPWAYLNSMDAWGGGLIGMRLLPRHGG